MSPPRSEDSKAFKKISFEFGGYKLRYAWVSQRGYYPEDLDKANQDQHAEFDNFGMSSKSDSWKNHKEADKDAGIEDCHFFGVFDGHGKTGDKCAIFARDHLPQRLVEELSTRADAVKTPGTCTNAIKDAYKAAFTSVNQMLHDDNIDDTMSGTTAICALFVRGSLYVANVGDSRAIIGEETNMKLIAKPLSVDQTPFRKDERERCKLKHAVVANMDQMDGLEEMHESWQEATDGDEDDDTGDPPRIWLKDKMLPGCAFTRSIGDSIGESVGVFAEPEVEVRDLKSQDKYVILASDGVWEFLTNQTVLNMVMAYKSPLKACKAVVNESYKLWLQYDVRTDDITMIAIYLEEMAGIDAAHVAESATISNDAKNADTPAKRISLRELRRKSSAPAKPIMPTGVTKQSQEEEIKAVRRVMTKEKKRMIVLSSSSSAEDDKHAEMKVAEAGFKYEVSTDQVGATDILEITKAVSTNFLLAHLTESQKEAVFTSMETCVCKAGDTIIRAGQPGDWFYVVQSGHYDAYIEDSLIHSYNVEGGSKDEEVHGVSFGELALLYNNQPRAASIMCSVDGKLWRLHARKFKEIVMRSSRQQLLKTLRSVEVLRELTLSQLQRLYDALSEVKVTDGTYIIKEGDSGTDFFVIMEGQAKVLKKGPSGAEEQVMLLNQYDYFGERALLNAAPRAASVVAVGIVKVVQISKTDFEDVLGSLDEIIDQHRRKREEGARRAHMRRQAEGLLDASPSEFIAVAKAVSWQVSDLYVVKRRGDGDDAKDHGLLTMRVVSKKKSKDMNLQSRVMSEIKLVGDMLPSIFVPSLLAAFSDRPRMYAVMAGVLSCELAKITGGTALIDKAEGMSTVRFYVAAIVLAVSHLHRHEILCRMISLDAIMLNELGYPVLLDFTLSKKLTDCGGRTYTLCGMAEYNSPEQRAIGDAFAKGQRRPSLARLHVSTGGGELEDTVATYKAIAAYSISSPPLLPFPPNATEVSQGGKQLLEDLLDPKPEERLGARYLEDLFTHIFFEGFNFASLEDKSMSSPYLGECTAASAELYKLAKDEKAAVEISVTPYVGDNRWCDDWDYTCTMGASVEATTDAPSTQPLSQRRKSQSAPSMPPVQE